MMLAQILLSVVMQSAQGTAIRTQIVYAHHERLFLNAGSEVGVSPGQLGEVVSTGKHIVRFRILKVADHQSVATYTKVTRFPRPGEWAIVKTQNIKPQVGVTAVTAAQTQESVNVATFVFEKVAYKSMSAQRGQSVNLWRSVVRLSGTTWVSMLQDAEGDFFRESLYGQFSGSIDEARHWVLNGAFTATLQQTKNATARYRTDELFRFEAYRGSIAYEGFRHWRLLLGRERVGRLRYNLIDGAAVLWHTKGGPTIEVSAGWRPDPNDLAPNIKRPAVRLGIDGTLNLNWGAIAYGWEASWLGETSSQSVIEAGETSARLSLNIGSWWWNTVEAGIVWVAPTNQQANKVVVERLQFSSSLRLANANYAHINVRRTEDAQLPSEAGGFIAQSSHGVYDSSLGFSHKFPHFSAWELGADVAAGGTLGSDTAYNLYWGSAAMTAHTLWHRLRVRLGFRYTGGWAGSSVLSVGIGWELIEKLRIHLMQRAGFWILEHRGTPIPTISTRVRVAYRFAKKLTAGIRVYGHYLDFDRGIRGELWIGLENE